MVMKNRISWKTLIVFVLSFTICLGFTVIAHAEGTLSVGAAKRDITPTEDMFPIEYVGTSMGSYLVGVYDPIYVRVIAVNDGEETAIIICTESGKGPYGPQFVPLYAEHAGIPADNVFFTTTHDHAVPEIKRPIDIDLDVNDTSLDTLDRWAKMTYLMTLEAIDEAMENMQPATMGVGKSNSYINVNRLRTFVADDGTTHVGQGYNPEGVSDKTLTVVEFDDMDGKPIAFLSNYAMHATVMYGAPYDGWNCAVSGDVPGYVSRALEEKYEGAVAIWTSGAAGDQNPIIAHGLMSPSTEDGNDYMLRFSVEAKEILTYLGDIHFADTLAAIRSITEKTSETDISCGYAGTTIPSDTAENGEFGVQLQLVKIGDLALFGHGGELYNSLALGMQEVSTAKYTLVVDNVWSHEEQEISYHCDDAAIENGSYHDTTLYKPGYLQDALNQLTLQLLEAAEK